MTMEELRAFLQAVKLENPADRRNGHALGIRTIAKEAGVCTDTLYRICNGATPRLWKHKPIEQAIGRLLDLMPDEAPLALRWAAHKASAQKAEPKPSSTASKPRNLRT